MARESRLSPEQWQDLINYYNEGHTLTECGRIWGLSHGYISERFNKMKVKKRARFEPSRPEKFEKAPPHTKAKFEHLATAVKEKERDPEALYVFVPPVRPDRAPRRKIVTLNDSDKKAVNLYEKEY